MEATKKKNGIEITSTRTIKDKDIGYLLSCAFDGGSGYWVEVVERVNPDNEKWEFTSDLPLTENGYVMMRSHLEPKDDPDNKPVKLDKEALYKGLQIMATKYPIHYHNFVDDNYDAETGDVFLQCCLLGEIVYG